jgi:hypothetical protein
MGRVKVASAGVTTSVLAVERTLPEAAAMGRATTNTTDPSTVARKQPGRTSATSVMAAMELSSARLMEMLPMAMVTAKNRAKNLIFIKRNGPINFVNLALLVRLRPVAALFKLFVTGRRLIYPAGVSYKSVRIAGIIESLQGHDLDARYLGFFQCFNRQLYFEAHEVLEDLWLPDRRGPNGDFYKGLIQLAGAFVHLQKNRLRPSAALFRLAQANFEKYPARHERLNLAAVQILIGGWLIQLEKGTFCINPLTAHNVPQLALQP